MKNTIELNFCDYCEKSIETISIGKCSVCDKDYCKACVDTTDHNYYGYNNKRPNVCKYCIDTVSNMLYKNEFKLKRLHDYRMSGNPSLINIGSYYRYYNDLFQSIAQKQATNVFAEMMREALNKKEYLLDIANKRKEIEKEFQDKMNALKN